MSLTKVYGPYKSLCALHKSMSLTKVYEPYKSLCALQKSMSLKGRVERTRWLNHHLRVQGYLACKKQPPPQGPP